MLSEEQTKQLQTLYKKNFGRDISQEEANKIGIKLLRLVELIYRPMTEEEYKQLEKRRRETGDI